jgi:DNA-binding transcriptional LysR family regulator
MHKLHEYLFNKAMSTSIPLTFNATRFDMRQVNVFLHVAEELHYGKAAERLFVSQSALSRSVQSLEEALGVILFERSTRKVKLTAAGEAFAVEARLALVHIERARAAASGATNLSTKRIRVGYMDFAINGCLPEIFNNFHNNFPDDIIDLRYGPTQSQKKDLIEGKLDVAIIIGKLNSNKVKNILIEKYDYVALVPEQHPLAKNSEIKIEDLADLAFVLGNEESFGTFRQLFFPICHAVGFHPKIIQEASSTTGILGMVAAGVGLSVYAGCARNLQRAGVLVKPIINIKDLIPSYACWVTENNNEVENRFHQYLESYALNDG